MEYAIVIAVIVLIGIICWGTYENNHVMVTNYELDSKRVPRDMKGLKIVQLSDLHNIRNEELRASILYKVKCIEPDLIVFTGDMLDKYRPNVKIALDFMQKLSNIAPTYYTFGNHDYKAKDRLHLFNSLYDFNENIASNNAFVFKHKRQRMNIIALEDPVKAQKYNKVYGLPKQSNKEIVNEALEELKYNHRNFTILISHRPDFYKEYDRKNIDLVFTGHAHGGQFNIPPFGPLYAPGQGILPKYAGGMYDLKHTKMIVNRGIGNSTFPFRLNNRPEIVVVTLKNSYY